MDIAVTQGTIAATALPDVRETPLGQLDATAVLDRLRPTPADASKPAVAAFNASL